MNEGKSLHLSEAEAHRLNIANRTVTMPDAMVGVMGGMSKAEAYAVVRQSLGRIKRSPRKVKVHTCVAGGGPCPQCHVEMEKRRTKRLTAKRIAVNS